MIVTFPHLGPLSIALSKMFSALDITFIAPPSNGERALLVGSAICPEEICLPFKYMAGNLKEAFELGADTAVMVATNGPCRLGEYGELLKIVLDREGCNYEWILLDAPAAIGAREAYRRIRALLTAGGAGRLKVSRTVVSTIKLIRNIDSFRKRLLNSAGYLKEPRQAVKLLHDVEGALENSGTFRECSRIIKQAKKELVRFARRDNEEPVKILIAGEIYTSIEPEANGRLEELLMEMGCSVRRHIDISWWLRRTLMPHRCSEDTLGGYARETIDEMIKDRWSDGIIRIMPAGCMPEIVTKGMCRQITEAGEKKVLELIYDEMSGQAGYKTRIEAFVDMLERRKYVLAWDRHRIDQH